MENSFVKIIVGLVVLFSLVFLFTKMANVYDDASDKQICKQAIRSMAATKIKGQDTIRLFNKRESKSGVECPIIYKEVSAKSEEALKRSLAGYMYDSWDMMGEGRLELFSAEDDETYCILTHHITFSDNAKDLGKVEGFTQFLANNKVPNIKGDKTYFEYLKCYNTPQMTDEPGQIESNIDTLDTSKDYGIMFIYAKKEHLHKVWGAVEGSKWGTIAGGVGAILLLFPEPSFTKAAGSALIIGAGAAAGGGAGYALGEDTSADWAACTVLFPYEKEYLEKFQCTYMPGIQGARPQ